MKITVRILLMALLVPLISQSPSQGAEDILNRISINPTIPQVAPMIFCKNELQRDCVERVVIEHPDGTFEDAKYVTTNLISFPDKQGQKVVYGDVIFDFNSGSKVGPLKRLRISTHVQTPEFSTDGKKWAVYWLMLQRQALPGEDIPIVNNCDGVDFKTCIPYPALDTEDKFHMYFRTSWLKPVAGGGEGIDSSLHHQRIPGGMRWKFSGKEFFQPIFKNSALLRKSATPEGEDLKPDQLNPTLYAVIDHAGATQENSFWNPNCADFGFTLTMSNAPMAGQLFWNYATESLIFNIYAPHLNAFGQRNTGTFHTKFHQAWLDCRFPGNTLSTATKITVQVMNEDGTPQIAVSSTSVKDGLVEIYASGFHYSSPSIIAKRSLDSSISTTHLNSRYEDDWKDPFIKTESVPQLSTPLANEGLSSKPVTITCVKGKMIRKITKVKPACPKGFKKKA